MHQAERGLFELGRGRMVCVTGGPEVDALVAAVEGLTDATLETLRRFGSAPPRLVVTSHRASAMGLTADPHPGSGRRNGQRPALSLGLPGSPPAERIVRLSSATGKHASLELDSRGASSRESATLGLLRLGRLLPALVSVPIRLPSVPALEELLETGSILRVPASEIETMIQAASADVKLVSEASVPLEGAEDARVFLFREAHGLFEHVAVMVGEPDAAGPPLPVRIHSACVTGDLFGSLRCDCGDQLRGSMRLFVGNGAGLLLYLAHEGRSIGLANKLRAYAMQEEGLDTLDADCALGFGPDERSYGAAAQILRHFGVDRIHLLTNNPDKVRAMEEAGIPVAGRAALHGTLTPQNLPYLSAKARRAGHWMEGMLSKRLPGG